MTFSGIINSEAKTSLQVAEMEYHSTKARQCYFNDSGCFPNVLFVSRIISTSFTQKCLSQRFLTKNNEHHYQEASLQLMQISQFVTECFISLTFTFWESVEHERAWVHRFKKMKSFNVPCSYPQLVNSP